ncbi:MAG: hypothetical protein E7298_02730 [Lachnospiraceae bacterium]|nr:hypothetical protein [Lachnospiraceae bacterium]
MEYMMDRLCDSKITTPIQKRRTKCIMVNPITYKGIKYECRRYTLSELEKLFNKKEFISVALADTEWEDMSNLKSGVLVDVFPLEEKNAKQYEYLKSELKYDVYDFGPQIIGVGLGSFMYIDDPMVE